METLLRNHYFFAPVKLGYCDQKDGKVNQRHLNFYKKRTHAIGAVIPEPFYLEASLRENPFQLGIDADDKISGLKSLTDMIHANGAKVVAHLNHPGRMANAVIPGNVFWSSVDTPCENGGAVPQKMDRSMMDHVVDLYVHAAKRAEQSGFDMLELQFGNGYLMQQFLSPTVNQRQDEYGNSFEHRIRFPFEVLTSIQKTTDLPIIVRLNGGSNLADSLPQDEILRMARLLEQHNIFAIHVINGSSCAAPAWYYQHMFIPKGMTWEFAHVIQQEVSIPVIFHGRIHSTEDIATIQDQFQGNYFSIGRALVADEHFMEKLLGQETAPIRPCMACSDGCLGGVRAGSGLACLVNPYVNTAIDKQKTLQPKKVAIVGGGLAGMEAAVTLTEQGHEVILFEKNQLGGQFVLADLPPKKKSLREVIDYYIKMIEFLHIHVVKEAVTQEMIEQGQFDAVVMATGSVPAIPPIAGLKDFAWAEMLEEDRLPQNQKVLIIGGGLIGVEVASALVDAHNEITIVEALDEIARGLEMIERTLTLKKLKENHVAMLLQHKVVKIDHHRVWVEDAKGEQRFLGDFDQIVVATGMKSYLPFNVSLPTYVIGDAKTPAKAMNAIRDAAALVI
jgi:2,4-dienoyl-CoA reductase-like NADH-dependent reductase (Old Yellow Enzyme family)/thioredoxin reductase